MQPATPCVDGVNTTRVEQAATGRTRLDVSRDERTALRREYAWVEAAAYAAIRARI